MNNLVKIGDNFPCATSSWRPCLFSMNVGGTLEDTLVEYMFFCSRNKKLRFGRETGRCDLPSLPLRHKWHIVGGSVSKLLCKRGKFCYSSSVKALRNSLLKVLKYNFPGAKVQNALAEMSMPANVTKKRFSSLCSCRQHSLLQNRLQAELAGPHALGVFWTQD